MPYDNDFRMPFEPAVEPDANSEARCHELEAPATFKDKRATYNAALKRRISTGSIGSEGITWTPTIVNRDRAFELQGRQMLVEALSRASYEEREMLERFVDNAQAMTELLQHGKLPAGLKDHWRHPIRGGGSLKVNNVCIMTIEAHDALREQRIYPALHSAYQDQWQAIKHFANRRGYGNASRVEQLEMFAASALTQPGVRRLPSMLIRPIEIGYPRETVVLSEMDFDLRGDFVALQQEANAQRQSRQRGDRAERPAHLPAPQSQRRRDRGPRR